MTTTTIPTGDIELWTESLGDPTHPPILLVMGANASAMYWPDEFMMLLVAGARRVIRYDHRDTGRSTHGAHGQRAYAVADLAADAVAVLDGYGLPSAHVVGLSMGGTIGQILAIDYPTRLRSLTLMLTSALDVDFVGNISRAFAGEPAPDGLPTPDPSVLRVLARRSAPGRDREAEVASRIEEWRALSGPVLPFVAEDFRRWEERAIEHAGTHVQPNAHALATPFPLTRGSELRDVRTPTLVIQGTMDPLNPPPHGRHLAELIPGARLVEISGLGHALPTAAHAWLAALILTHTCKAPC